MLNNSSFQSFLFQGQGSQLVAMGEDISKDFPVARKIFDEVDEALGEKLSHLIFNGPKAELDLTENTQPALMAMSIAVVKIVESELGMAIKDLCKYVAGHSLGEYSAACAAGVMSIADCAKILKLRGKSMQAAVPVGKGLMAAILGADIKEVESLIESSRDSGVCEIANNNCPGQIVISGEYSAVEKAINLAKDNGFKSIKLEVSAPFHCRLMEPVADVLAEAFQKIEMFDSSVPIICNYTARPVQKSEDIKEMLLKQTYSQVKWYDSILYMSANKCDTMVEFGTGKVLVGLNKRINPEINTIALNSSENIRNFLENIKNAL